MTDDQSNRISDEMLRRYLLGALPENERQIIDEMLLLDDEFEERVQLAESLLIDDFATSELDAHERALFTNKFLVTDTRRQALQLSESLHERALQVRPAAVPRNLSSWKERLAGYFAFVPKPGWATAGGLALVILIVGLIWSGVRQHERIAQQMLEEVARNEPLNVTPTPITAAQPLPTPHQSEAPIASPPPAIVASFVLLPGAVRADGNMTRVAIPSGDSDTLRLSLVLETPGDGTFQAELVTAEGQKVLMRPNLKPVRNGQSKIVLTIPARLLSSRDYQIKLSRKSSDGLTESAGRYYFRALEE